MSIHHDHIIQPWPLKCASTPARKSLPSSLPPSNSTVAQLVVPPNHLGRATGVDDLQVAWEACPADCTPLVAGDLNIQFEDPANNRVDAIVDLLEEINTTNFSCNFLPRQCSQQWRRVRWTFHEGKGGGAVLFTTGLFSRE